MQKRGRNDEKCQEIRTVDTFQRDIYIAQNGDEPMACRLCSYSSMAADPPSA